MAADVTAAEVTAEVAAEVASEETDVTPVASVDGAEVVAAAEVAAAEEDPAAEVAAAAGTLKETPACWQRPWAAVRVFS